jgi:hypothetical protein
LDRLAVHGSSRSEVELLKPIESHAGYYDQGECGLYHEMTCHSVDTAKERFVLSRTDKRQTK